MSLIISRSELSLLSCVARVRPPSETNKNYPGSVHCLKWDGSQLSLASADGGVAVLHMVSATMESETLPFSVWVNSSEFNSVTQHLMDLTCQLSVEKDKVVFRQAESLRVELGTQCVPGMQSDLGTNWLPTSEVVMPPEALDTALSWVLQATDTSCSNPKAHYVAFSGDGLWATSPRCGRKARCSFPFTAFVSNRDSVALARWVALHRDEKIRIEHLSKDDKCSLRFSVVKKAGCRITVLVSRLSETYPEHTGEWPTSGIIDAGFLASTGHLAAAIQSHTNQRFVRLGIVPNGTNNKRGELTFKAEGNASAVRDNLMTVIHSFDPTCASIGLATSDVLELAADVGRKNVTYKWDSRLILFEIVIPQKETSAGEGAVPKDDQQTSSADRIQELVLESYYAGTVKRGPVKKVPMPNASPIDLGSDKEHDPKEAGRRLLVHA